MRFQKTDIVIIGYSGHAYVAIDILLANKIKVMGYFDQEEKSRNPYQLAYLGSESTAKANEIFETRGYFIGVGNNGLRWKIYEELFTKYGVPINAVHPSSVISSFTNIGRGVMICANTAINALANIGNGVICNTNSTIEHECKIGDFAHIAPGAVLAGNVKIGMRSFIGANSVIKQGINIGDDVMIGAGSVVIRDIPNGATAVGNPARIIKQSTFSSND